MGQDDRDDAADAPASDDGAAGGATEDADADEGAGAVERTEGEERTESTEDEAAEPIPDEITDLRYVGPATASALADGEIDAAAIARRRVSFRDLVEAGVNPGVAARIRREHSLAWSMESSGEDLERRSGQVRGLSEDERAWVAASAGDWESATREDDGPTEPVNADGSGDEFLAETSWRERSAPTPVTTVSGIGEAYAARLAEAGITSVRSLAAADPEDVAEALGLSRERVRDWHEAAARSLE